MKRKRLGEILQDRGKISAESLQRLFKEQEGSKMTAWESSSWSAAWWTSLPW
jgi:hypothetical protein